MLSSSVVPMCNVCPVEAARGRDTRKGEMNMVLHVRHKHIAWTDGSRTWPCRSHVVAPVHRLGSTPTGNFAPRNAAPLAAAPVLGRNRGGALVRKR